MLQHIAKDLAIQAKRDANAWINDTSMPEASRRYRYNVNIMWSNFWFALSRNGMEI